MKLPLKYGIPLLIVLWLASGYTDYGQGKTGLMMLAMGVAMWTAFSLPRPRRRQWEEAEDAEGDAEAEPQGAPGDGAFPTNGSGRRAPSRTAKADKES